MTPALYAAQPEQWKGPPCAYPPIEVVAKIFREWCKLLDLPTEPVPPPHVLQQLAQGGECLRSCIQFVSRSSEPHCVQQDEELADQRSQRAVNVLCLGLSGSQWYYPSLGDLLHLSCCELLGGLQPPSRGASHHICTALQRLLLTHEADVVPALLYSHAPFLLLRSLERPGCSELLQTLLGGDAVLSRTPPLPGRPLQVQSLWQVQQYLIAYQWPACVESVASQGAKQPAARGSESCFSTPSRCKQPTTPPSTPGPKAGCQSPGTLLGWMAEATPCSTPQRFPRAREVQGSAAFESLPAQISSPSTEVVYTERVPARPSLPATPEGREQSASPPRSPPGSGVQTSRSDLADSACTQGAGVLLDFLTSLLYTMKRPSKADRPRAWEDPNSEGRSEVQHQLIYDLFVSTPLISTMFLLVDKESGSVPLLTALLQHAVNRADTDFALAVVTRCLPHVSLLCTRVLGSPRLRPREPLGALRVEATQILAALAVLSPDRLLPLVKPAVWKALSEWFFLYRCNHIFQAACSKLWVQIIRFGSPELQHLIFVKGHLLRGLCHAVLGEGSCGDRWHDLLQNVEPDGRSGRIEKSQVPQQRPRHPGGLGSMVPVVRALSELEDSFKESKAPIRQPLAEKQVHEVPMDRKVKACAKPLLVQLLSATSLWPQVLKALPPAPPLGDVVAPFQQVPRKPATTVGFDI